MGINSWLSSQTLGIKAIIGLAIGLLCYLFLRGLIYLANKEFKAIPKKKVGWKEKLELLAKDSG